MSKHVYTFLPPDQGPNAPPQVYGRKKQAVKAALGYGCIPVGETETQIHVFNLDRFGKTVVDKGVAMQNITVYSVTVR